MPTTCSPRALARCRQRTGLAGLLLTTCLITIAPPARAQTEEPVFLGTIVVTANRSERPVSAIPGAVQVIGEDEITTQIEQGGDATSLLARLVPGFSFGNQTLSGASETFRGRSLLVMVDGVPRNTPLRDSSRTLSLIDLASVERIEVIGGASSLYGAGATGGVVNFITRSGANADGTARVTVDLRAKAFTTDIGASIAPELSVQVDQKIGAFDYAFTLSGWQSRETFDGDGNLLPSDPMLGQGGGDHTKAANLGLRLGYDIDDAKRIELSFEQVRLDQRPEYFTSYTVSPVAPDLSRPYYGKPVTEDSNYLTLRYTDQDFALGKLAVTFSRNDVMKRFSFNVFDPVVNTLVYYSGNPADPTADYNQSELESLRNTLTVAIDSPLTIFGREAGLSWGFEAGTDETRQNAINGQAISTPLDSDSRALFAQLTLPVNDALTLSGGIRYDHYDLTVGNFSRPRAYYYFPAYRVGLDLAPVSVTGGEFTFEEFTGNLGFTWKLSEATQLFGGWSQGYSLTDIGSFTRRAGMNSVAEICTAYGNDNPLIAGAYGCSTPGTYALSYADIGPKPQVVDTWEIGLRHEEETWNGQISAWYSTSDEGVNFNPVTNQVSQQREEIWGIEAQGMYALSDATVLDGMIAYREGRVDKNGDGNVDAWIGNNRIGSPLRARLGVTQEFGNGWRARVEALHLAGRDRAPGEIDLQSVNLVNASVSKQIGPGLFSVAVENLFDKGYANPTATATRNVDSMGLGRTVTVGYRVSF
ncbi:TonB-dependent receptor [Pseudomonas sp. GX19020]|uniref:TonB-dependent receptor n=1 Tax=Pseudomonas sp. GX19020 TaxID=2942277 RepID=UPI0020187DBB|nr:TonB-dependent receptor [Pseudomonas sp. GX19020]MCL4066107.1 TonB-dependent receptor [Pseudomonas sp. GX19020]